MNRADYLKKVSEEINLIIGLKSDIVKDKIEVYTIAGIIKLDPIFNVVMKDVYRFIYIYGIKLNNFGRESLNKLERELK